MTLCMMYTVQGCPKKKWTAQNCYIIQTKNYTLLKQRPIDRYYRSFDIERSSECDINVNLRLGLYCRCSEDGTPRPWSEKVRNRIYFESGQGINFKLMHYLSIGLCFIALSFVVWMRQRFCAVYFFFGHPVYISLQFHSSCCSAKSENY